MQTIKNRFNIRKSTILLPKMQQHSIPGVRLIICCKWKMYWGCLDIDIRNRFNIVQKNKYSRAHVSKPIG